jgi:hypothetical protein
MEDYAWGCLSLSPANHFTELLIVNSAPGKISHVPMIIISGFIGLAYKLNPCAFFVKKKKKKSFIPNPLTSG